MSDTTAHEGREVLVDARGLRCPLPVIRLGRESTRWPAGTVLRVLATDPAAQHDIPAWARLRGHRLLRIDVSPPAAGDDRPVEDIGPARDDGRGEDVAHTSVEALVLLMSGPEESPDARRAPAG